ncbi:MAG TPA: HEAT repeat domain-containing protein, partial [Candidatus Acidoferrum sp.]|nr:HEAT repeat domain-containing protein [Candidatus Acidoferrum sp.]
LAVVEKLAQEYDFEAVKPLIFALKDKGPDVRCAAAKALLRYNDPQAVEPLIQTLRDTEPLARAAAAETLGRLNDTKAIPPLVQLLRDVDPIVRGISVRSLNRLGWKPASAPDRVLQILAMGNLQELVAMGPEGVGHLLETLRDGTPNKQFAAVKALGQTGDQRVRPAMVEALKKKVPVVRMAALGVLESLADPETFPEIEPLLEDEAPGVRSAAVEAATLSGGRRAVPSLVKCLKDTSWEVRQAAAKSLGVLGDTSAVEDLCQVIQDPDRDVRECVIVALGELGDPRAIQPLVLALLDTENTVRNAASSALYKINRRWDESESAHRALPKIKASLKHSDYWVCQAASKLLQIFNVDVQSLRDETANVKLMMKSGPSPVYALFADLLFDRDRDLRLAAAVSLGRLRDRNATAILSTASRDADYCVRQAALSALTALE